MFIFNEGCFNLDGFCTFHHGIGQKRWDERILACSLPYKTKVIEKISPSKERTIRHKIENISKNLLINCGACALYDFNKSGVDGIKIVGRGNPTEKKIKDVRFFNALLELVKKCKDKSSFESKAKERYKKFYSYSCTPKNCYY